MTKAKKNFNQLLRKEVTMRAEMNFSEWKRSKAWEKIFDLNEKNFLERRKKRIEKNVQEKNLLKNSSFKKIVKKISRKIIIFTIFQDHHDDDENSWLMSELIM